MAKKSMIMREAKRAKLVARQAEKRKALKAVVRSIHSSDDEKAAAQAKLNALPRDGSPTEVCGGPHQQRRAAVAGARQRETWRPRRIIARTETSSFFRAICISRKDWAP